MSAKKTYITIFGIAAVAIIFSAYAFTLNNKKHKQANNKSGFAVVELFTSEGCSSCPPADRAVATLLQKNTDNVYILAYHVDYWNRLGWKDAFSKAEFSARQQQYGSHFSSESIYTPQVIVNGITQFVGSDEEKLNHAVLTNLQSGQSSDLTISAIKNNNSIAVSYHINEKEPVLLNVALVQPQASTAVKGGENGGRTLHHVNIVRELKTIDATGEGTVTIVIPSELSGLPLKLIAFTQEKNNFKILGADKKESL